MKYEIIDQVPRFVERFGMIMDPETMKKARDEAIEYDFRRISEGHYAVQHNDKMYVIIERDGQIGCSCEDMTFNRMDGAVCKHIIEFSRLLTPVVKEIEEGDRRFLVNACGWTGKELHPEIELGGPGAVVQEDTRPAPKTTIPPDPDLNLGVDDPLPEPEKLAKVTMKCQYCGMDITERSNEDLLLAVEDHEAGCVKNPANDPKKLNDPLPEKNPANALPEDEASWAPDEEQTEQKSEEVKKMEDKPVWDQAAWDNATQGSFVSYGEDGIALVLFTSNDFEVGKPDKWGRVPCEFSVIQHNKSVILSVGAIGLMIALKDILPLENKLIKIIRTGEGTGTKYEVQDVTNTEVI